MYGKAILNKAFKFLESLFDNPHYSILEYIYADQIGLEYLPKKSATKVSLFAQSTNLLQSYTADDRIKLLSVFIKKKVDLSKIPTLFTHSPEFAQQAVKLMPYDKTIPESILNIAKVLNAVLEYNKAKAFSIFDTALHYKVPSLSELMSDLKSISDQSSTAQSTAPDIMPQLRHLTSFYMQAYFSGQLNSIIENMASTNYFNLLADIVSHVQSVKHCTVALQHADQLNPYSKQKIVNVLMQEQDINSMKALFQHPELINEVALAFISSDKFTTLACASLVKRHNDMSPDVKIQLIGYLQSKTQGGDTESLICKNLLATIPVQEDSTTPTYTTTATEAVSSYSASSSFFAKDIESSPIIGNTSYIADAHD